MANLEKIKDIKDCRKEKSPTVLELCLYYKRASAFEFTVGNSGKLIDKTVADSVINAYEDIIEYLVERLVHCDSERFS
jgi:hypothetical protein